MTNMFAFGVDVGGHNIRAACIESNGHIVDRVEFPTPPSRGFNDVVEVILNELNLLGNRLKVDIKNIAGLGVCIPGYVQQPDSTVTFAPNFPSWRGISFEKALKDKVPYRVIGENDGNAHVLGEAWMGAGAGKSNVVLFALGTGVGGGIVSEGNLIRGHNGAGGELGHLYVDCEEALQCGCGARGCLESVASATAIEQIMKVSPLELSNQARKGQVEARSYFEKMGHCLGLAITNMCMVFEPEVVVLSGKISMSMDLFEGSMRRVLDTRLKNHPNKKISVVPAEHIDDAGILGAARLCFLAH